MILKSHVSSIGRLIQKLGFLSPNKRFNFLIIFTIYRGCIIARISLIKAFIFSIFKKHLLVEENFLLWWEIYQAISNIIVIINFLIILTSSIVEFKVKILILTSIIINIGVIIAIYIIIVFTFIVPIWRRKKIVDLLKFLLRW